MTKIVASIDATATNTADARESSWYATLFLVNANGQRDSRPEATKDIDGTLPSGTHNQAALEAVRQVLLALKRDGLTVEILTTSDYVIGVLSRHWKPARNKELIADVKALIAKHNVTFTKFGA